jgi:hypothetical protein
MGRVTGDNVIHLPFNTSEILSQVKKYKNLDFHGANIYERNNGVNLIADKIKQILI